MAHIQNYSEEPGLPEYKWHRHITFLLWAGLIVGGLTSTVLMPSAFALDQTYKSFTADLRKYVQGNSVHYRRWQRDHRHLDQFIKEVGAVTAEEYKAFTPAQKKAFWLNTYNAFTVQLVLQHYPLHGKNPNYPANSLRQVPDAWDNFQIKAAGGQYSIDDLEHGVLRKLCDPRLQFAVSCAAKDSAPLLRQAYQPDSIDEELQAATDRFLSNKRNVDLNPAKKTLTVSKVFSWFPLDFLSAAGYAKFPNPPLSDDQIVIAYLAIHAPTNVKAQLSDANVRKQIKVIYRPYDWSLNDADEKDRGEKH